MGAGRGSDGSDGPQCSAEPAIRVGDMGGGGRGQATSAVDGGDGRGGAASGGGGGRDPALRPPPAPAAGARPAPLSLRLPPPEEAAYWREAGTPALAWLDQWALLYTAFNVAAGALLTKDTDHNNSMPTIVQQCLDAVSLILFTAAVAGRVWLSRHNQSYCRYRTAFAAVNRAVRSVYMLTVFTQMDVEGWADFVLHGKPGVTSPALEPPAAAAAVVKGLFSTGVFWAMHALLFPFRLSAAGPLHAAFCLAAWPALRGLACMVYADAALSAGARLVCERLQSVNRVALNTLGVGDDMWDAEEDSTCSARPMELLVPLACALSCFATLFILYERELAHKLAYLRRRSRGSGAAAYDAGEQQVPVRRLAVAAALLLMALWAGDVAAEWAPPYQCAAA